MLRSIINVPSAALDSIDAPKLNAYEHNIIGDIIEILTPFEEATDCAQVENVPSAGYVLPCIRGLEHQLNSMNSKYHSPFVTTLQPSLVKRMVVYEKKNDYIMAAMLDPRFKVLWCKDEEEKGKVKAIIEGEMAKIAPDPDTLVVESSDTTEIELEPPNKKRCLFTFMDKSRSNQSEPDDKEKELQKYLEEPCINETVIPLSYWKKNQHVYP